MIECRRDHPNGYFASPNVAPVEKDGGEPTEIAIWIPVIDAAQIMVVVALASSLLTVALGLIYIYLIYLIYLWIFAELRLKILVALCKTIRPLYIYM